MVNRLGSAMDIVGAYFVFRISLTTIESYKRLIKLMTLLCMILAVMMVIEQFTGRNLFSVFGGIPPITPIREGKLRSQGPFTHAIMAGISGALMIPLLWALRSKELNNIGSTTKNFAITLGIIAGLLVTITSASSTPIMGLGLTLVGLLGWRIRAHTKRLWLFSLILLIILDIFMEAPVYHLISRIDLVGGSTGYHRYRLMDAAVKRFGEWFLFGTKTTMYWGWGLQDVTNQYILEGIRGGFTSLMIYLYMIVLCFRKVGSIIFAEGTNSELLALKRIAWALATLLFSHIFMFFAVSYFAQMIPIFYLHIAMISSLTYENEKSTSEVSPKTQV